MQTKTTQKLILNRRGNTGTLEGGNENASITLNMGSAKCNARVETSTNAATSNRLFNIGTPESEVFDFIEEVLGEEVDRKNVMAYVIKTPLSSGYGEYPNDLYDASSIFSDYTKTFRTPIENYCIASVKEDGTLDFSCCDTAIRDAVMEKMNSLENPRNTFLDCVNNHAKWLFDRQGGDHVWTAWLLSEYLNGVEGIKSKRMTVKEFQSVYVHYVHGCPVYTTSKVEVA